MDVFFLLLFYMFFCIIYIYQVDLAGPDLAFVVRGTPKAIN